MNTGKKSPPVSSAHADLVLLSKKRRRSNLHLWVLPRSICCTSFGRDVGESKFCKSVVCSTTNALPLDWSLAKRQSLTDPTVSLLFVVIRSFHYISAQSVGGLRQSRRSSRKGQARRMRRQRYHRHPCRIQGDILPSRRNQEHQRPFRRCLGHGIRPRCIQLAQSAVRVGGRRRHLLSTSSGSR